ncbi:MAG: hypothetical protein K6G84_08430 [Lachnospiraceae bacterium]|nr:hypothetical protein [Lachnospiraceae bacterium]
MSRKSKSENNIRKAAGAIITAAVLLLGGSQALPALQHSGTPDKTYMTEAATEISDEHASDGSTEVILDHSTEASSESATEAVSEAKKVNNDAIQTGLRFRNKKLLNQHYEKHGIEMGFSSAKAYENAASEVPASEEALHKTEKEDGDDVYYIEETNEFVVVSTDGYIRTYFNPNSGIKYFNKQ